VTDDETYEFYANPENRRIVGPPHERKSWSWHFGETVTVNSAWPAVRVTMGVSTGGGGGG